VNAVHARHSPLPLRLDGVAFAAGGVSILADVSLTFDAGPRTVILGPNGAGKSVLLRLCHGLLRPTAGQMRWAQEIRGRERPDAMVFQRPVMLRRSVRANVEYGLKLRGLARADRRRVAAAKLEAVGLAHLAERPARRLSGGEQQRVALARAFVTRPEVLFADEPTGNLDAATGDAVIDLLFELNRDSGTTLVLVTHDEHLATRCHRSLRLDHGRLVSA
jgi:tungstate transport system ATP-binding protein